MLLNSRSNMRFGKDGQFNLARDALAQMGSPLLPHADSDMRIKDDFLFSHYQRLHCQLMPVEVHSDESTMIAKYMNEVLVGLTYEEQPVQLLNWKNKTLCSKEILLVKILWHNHSGRGYMGMR